MTQQANFEPAGFPAYLATVRDLVWEGFGITLSFQAKAEAHASYEVGQTPAQCARLIGTTASLRPG
jgi:hypothetical protein